MKKQEEKIEVKKQLKKRKRLEASLGAIVYHNINVEQTVLSIPFLLLTYIIGSILDINIRNLRVDFFIGV